MGWTKKQLIEEAYAELALAGYVYDLQPEEMQGGLRRLDTMLATWDMRGLSLGYLLPSTQTASDVDQDSGLPDVAIETVFLNLAVRIAAGFGKTLPASTLTAARDGFQALMARAAFPQEQQLPGTMPRGAGNRPWRNINRPFFTKPDTSPLRNSQGNDLDIITG